MDRNIFRCGRPRDPFEKQCEKGPPRSSFTYSTFWATVRRRRSNSAPAGPRRASNRGRVAGGQPRSLPIFGIGKAYKPSAIMGWDRRTELADVQQQSKFWNLSYDTVTFLKSLNLIAMQRVI
jgi:hypothetical protein